MDTAVLLYAPALDAVAAAWRGDGDADVPPHLVLAHPFLAADAVDVGVEEELRWFFRGVDGLRVRFGEVQRRDGVLWLLPERPSEVVDLAAALALRWPELAPVEPPVPSVALARGDDAHLDEVARDVQRLLPLDAELVRAGLWVRDGAWAERAVLPLAEPD